MFRCLIKFSMFLCQKLAAGDFKANTGEIIHDILGAANKVDMIANKIIIPANILNLVIIIIIISMNNTPPCKKKLIVKKQIKNSFVNN